MTEENSKPSRRRQSKREKQVNRGLSIFAVVLVVLAVVVAVGLAVSQMFVTRDEVTTEAYTPEVKVRAVDCETRTPKDAFFKTPEDALEADHELKMTYSGEMAQKIQYTFETDYATPEEAAKAETELHGDYNKFMAQYAGDFTPHFALDGDDLKISLITDTKELAPDTAKLFFITPEEYAALNNYKVEELVKIFQNKGFHCEYDD